MGDQELDPYEQQLRLVFDSCDEEKKGTLNANSLQQLCNKLQLEERGIKLIERLLGGSNEDQVTFHAFRGALLALLHQGPEMEQAQSAAAASTEEEAVPKLIFGKKKYGRSSSPLGSSQEIVKESSEIQHEGADILDAGAASIAQPKKRKTARHSDTDNSTLLYSHDTEICLKRNIADGRDFQKVWDSSNVIADNEQHPGSSLQANRASPICYSDDTGKMLPLSTSSLNSETVVELWEGAGLLKPAALLQDLGFTKSTVIVAELIGTLKEEILNLQSATVQGNWSITETLLQAVLTLIQLELQSATASLEILQSEKNKLQNNICEANERASLLAQELDENHAQLEKSSDLQIKIIEQKHTEHVRLLMDQTAVEREQIQSKNSLLEVRVKNLEEINFLQRTKLSLMKEEKSTLVFDKECAVQNWTKLQTLYQSAQTELKSFDSVRDELTKLRSVCEVEQVLPLKERIVEIQAANTELRDRNDELTMKLEALTLELSANKMKELPSIPQVPAHSIAVPDGDTDEEIEPSDAANMSDSAVGLPFLPCVNVVDPVQTTSELNLRSNIDLLVETAINVGLKEQNAELLKSLELMRVEYEQCEDYWSSKVEEERVIHDRVQNAMGEKYTELLTKIQQYEDENKGHKEKPNTDSSSSRLMTIQEHVDCEHQIEALEEESRQLKVKLDQKTEHDAVMCEKRRIARRKHLRTVRKLRHKLKQTSLVNVTVEHYKTFKNEVKHLEVLKAEMVEMMGVAVDERRKCEAVHEAHEASSKEEREHIIYLLSEAFKTPRGIVEGIRCDNMYCNDNKRSLFVAMKNQCEMMKSLQMRIGNQKTYIAELSAILKKSKLEHEKEVKELKEVVSMEEEQVARAVGLIKAQDLQMVKNDVVLTSMFEENARVTKSLADLELRCKELMELSEKPSSSMGKVC